MNDGDLQRFLENANKAEELSKTFDDKIALANTMLRDSELDHVYDTDFQTRSQLMAKYAIKQARHYNEQGDEFFVKRNLAVPDDAEERIGFIKRMAQEDAKDRCWEEKSIVGHVALLMCAKHMGSTDENVTAVKKRILAESIVGGMSLSDPILQYFMQAAPGENLDPEAEDDLQYMVEAMLNTQDKEEKGKKLDVVIKGIWGLLRQWTVKNPEKMHDVACDAALAVVYDNKIFKDTALFKRENHIFEVLRNYGISQILGAEGDQSLIQAIMGIIESQFPINNEQTE